MLVVANIIKKSQQNYFYFIPNCKPGKVYLDKWLLQLCDCKFILITIGILPLSYLQILVQIGLRECVVEKDNIIDHLMITKITKYHGTFLIKETLPILTIINSQYHNFLSILSYFVLLVIKYYALNILSTGFMMGSWLAFFGVILLQLQVFAYSHSIFPLLSTRTYPQTSPCSPLHPKHTREKWYSTWSLNVPRTKQPSIWK